MAKAPTAAIPGGPGGLAKLTELRQRILFVIGALLVYRLGTFIPVPGIDPVQLAKFFEANSKGILGMFNMFSGGALERLSVFALGIMPYISAAIIMQLLQYVVPSLERLKKEGESGRRKITQYTRYATVVLATFQALTIAIALQEQGMVWFKGPGFVFTATVTLVTGTLFLMWLGEQITERGIGNGISLIIFAGIVAGLPGAIGLTLDLVNKGQMQFFTALLLFVLVIAVTAFVVFVERGQRRITVNYAKRQQGRKMYAGQSSHLPFKLNMAGVLPPIFASSLILFPGFLAKSIGQGSENMEWLAKIAEMMSPGEPLYLLAYALLIVFFCFFYSALQYNPRETADNLKKSGAIIPGIRPGEQTARYIDGILTRLTTAGAIYLVLVCLLPQFVTKNFGVSFYFGGTSLLIIVVVIMDTIAQMQAHLMSHQYESLMKKANLKGYGGSGLIK